RAEPDHPAGRHQRPGRRRQAGGPPAGGAGERGAGQLPALFPGGRGRRDGCAARRLVRPEVHPVRHLAAGRCPEPPDGGGARRARAPRVRPGLRRLRRAGGAGRRPARAADGGLPDRRRRRDPVRFHRRRRGRDGEPARGGAGGDPGGRGAGARLAGRQAVGGDDRAVRAGDRDPDDPLAPAERDGAAVSAALLPPQIARRGIPIAVVALIVALAVVPPAIGGYVPRALTSYLIFGLLALSVGLISGYGRLFNLGVGANFGVSAYAVAVLSQYGLTNPFLLLVGALTSGLLVALLFSFYALVASGVEYLMLTFLTTLAFAVLPLALPDLLGGDNGLALKGGLGVSFGLNPLRGNEFYWFVLAVVVACALVSWFVVSSQAGKAVQAIGRNPIRAAAMGYSVSGYRVALTLYASLIASLGGWLYILQNSFVHQDLLGLGNSTNGLVYALIGGANTILGPFLGAVALRFVNDTFSRGSTQTPLYLGIVLMLVVYFVPDGLLGLWE